MHVVGPVAVVARGRKLNLFDVFGGVAGIAGEPTMSPCQRVFRLPVVVKAPTRPTIWVVTNGAIRSQSAFVVSVFVAARARGRRILVRRRLMALTRCSSAVVRRAHAIR
jgi:hypothetical protein